MALKVRRIVTGHDASGKAVVASDEEITGVASPARLSISRCEIWSTDRMPVDNSEGEAAGAARRLRQALQLCRHRPGHRDPGHRVRPRRAQVHAPHRDGRLRHPAVGRMRSRTRRRQDRAPQAGRHRRAARHDARLGQQRQRALRLRLRADRRQAGRDWRQVARHPLPGTVTAMEMQGRRIIVTGGASGIGRATALLLAREGAQVFVGDIDEKGGAALAGEGRNIEFHPLDLTQPASIEAFAAAAGPVDGLVNGAGWDRIEPFMQNPPEMVEQVISINLMGALRLTRAVLPPMIAAQAGKIVNISSDAGRVGSTGETVYAAAKGGIIAFTKSLAREMARYRINVNCVCPGPTDTPLF